MIDAPLTCDGRIPMRFPETAGPASTENGGVSAEMVRTGMITRIWQDPTVPNVQPSTKNVQEARVVPLNTVWPALVEEDPLGKNATSIFVEPFGKVHESDAE
jgi:hypothetical protein